MTLMRIAMSIEMRLITEQYRCYEIRSRKQVNVEETIKSTDYELKQIVRDL